MLHFVLSRPPGGAPVTHRLRLLCNGPVVRIGPFTGHSGPSRIKDTFNINIVARKGKPQYISLRGVCHRDTGGVPHRHTRCATQTHGTIAIEL